jgi:hypothetical protein
MVLQLLFVVFAPIALMGGSVVGLRYGLPLWLAVLFDVIVLVGAGYFLRAGVQEGCLIDQSECIGTTATAYMIAVFWLAAVLVLIVSAIQIVRERRR